MRILQTVLEQEYDVHVIVRSLKQHLPIKVQNLQMKARISLRLSKKPIHTCTSTLET